MKFRQLEKRESLTRIQLLLDFYLELLGGHGADEYLQYDAQLCVSFGHTFLAAGHIESE